MDIFLPYEGKWIHPSNLSDHEILEEMSRFKSYMIKRQIKELIKTPQDTPCKLRAYLDYSILEVLAEIKNITVPGTLSLSSDMERLRAYNELRRDENRPRPVIPNAWLNNSTVAGSYVDGTTNGYTIRWVR